MCFYIAHVVRGSDAATIDGVLRRHGRQAKPISSASIGGALVPGEAQFLTTVGHCDWGTALAPTVLDRVGKPTEQVAKVAKNRAVAAKPIYRRRLAARLHNCSRFLPGGPERDPRLPSNGRAQLAYMRLVSIRAGHALDFTRLRPRAFLAAMIDSFVGEHNPLKAELRRLR
jgi:hypothetical protein